MSKRRVLLVDDEVTVLLTMKAVLEISGFDVDTAASAREGRSKIKLKEYQMVITDMRMESDAAGREVIQAARTAPYHPAVALLTAFPDDDWADMGADKMLVKPMQTAVLIRQIEKLLESHSAKLARLANAASANNTGARNTGVKNTGAQTSGSKASGSKTGGTGSAAAKKTAAKRLASKRRPDGKLVTKPRAAAKRKSSTRKK